MKLGVSTLGCPDWTLDEILERLPRYGYEGVELRGLGPDLDLMQSPAFDTPSAIKHSRQAFADSGIETCGVDTSCSFTHSDLSARERSLEDGRRALDLAAALGAPTLRVFGGTISGEAERSEAAKRVVSALIELGDHAAQAGTVTIVLETHDAFSTGVQVAEVMRQTSHPYVRALWDMHHPFRQGEPPSETFDALGPYVEQTHVKDSKPNGTYCLLGDGDIPIFEMLHLLKESGYNGWLNLEWEKRWIPALPDPTLAFPQYAARLREYLNALS